jgi:hypothetical protein
LEKKKANRAAQIVQETFLANARKNNLDARKIHANLGTFL